MALFRRKYRIESARLPEWNYAAAGWYFVTICTKGRCCVFGEVINDTVHLSGIGKIVAEEWLKTEQVRVGVQLNQWVIMPNHLHGIVIIEDIEPPHRGGSTSKTSHWKTNSLSAIIGQFKSVCTKRIWAAGFREFSWQPRFYDHIIRDERSLHDIQEYIVNNPLKWELDKDNLENLYM